MLKDIFAVKRTYDPLTFCALSQTFITYDFFTFRALVKGTSNLATYVANRGVGEEGLQIFLPEDVSFVIKGDGLFFVFNWQGIIKLLPGNLMQWRILLQILPQIGTPPRQMSYI